ncbi:DUF4129 domain-containing protein [Tepidiforma sp.]|uniref:DUF4129 domain-containing protein n=1 Tax=Tepidiforma sp. TaxID=2682230 RepID=UPI002ADE098E|nr:DUF4129 domain-containing protein [Tepidiforma sp.]
MIAGAATGLAMLADALALACVATLVALVTAPERPDAGPISILLLVLAGFAVPRLAGALVEPRRATVAAVIGALVIVFTATSLEATGNLSAWTFDWVVDFYREPGSTMRAGAPAVIIALLLAVAWARGASRAEQDLDLELHARTMFLPFAIVVVSCVLGAGSSRAGDLATLSAAFFATAVASLAMAQLALGGATLGALRSGGITATLLVGTAVMAIAVFVIFGVLSRWLGPVVVPLAARAAERVLIVMLTPLAWVLTELFERLLQGVDPFQRLQPVLEQASNDQAANDTGGPTAAERVALFGLRTLGLIGFGAVLAAIVLAWTRARRRYARLREGSAPYGRSGGLAEDLLGLWKSLPRLRRDPGRPDSGGAAVRLYLAVLADAERRGHPREPARTPHEFQPVLHQAFQTPVTDEITKLFEEAQYAGRDPEPARVRDAAARWHAVKRG